MPDEGGGALSSRGSTKAPDRSEFKDFYSATVRAVVGQVYAVVGDWDEAQDAAHEAYARALPRWERLSTYDDPAAWVRTVSHRIATSRWRKARNAMTANHRGHRERVYPEPSANHVTLVGALRLLPENHRRAIVLFYLADLSVADVARELGVPENTAKVWLKRGRDALAVHLSDLAPGTEA